MAIDVKKTSKTPEDTLTKRSEIVMPGDTNMLHNLMGGNLLRIMDLTAAISAQKFAGTACVTACVDTVTFKDAIKCGEIITVEAKVVRAFNTSMEIYVRATKGTSAKVYDTIANEAYFTFVAIDEDFKPVTIPKLLPQTEEEKQMYENALVRRQMRHVLNGKIKLKDVARVIEVLEGNA